MTEKPRADRPVCVIARNAVTRRSPKDAANDFCLRLPPAAKPALPSGEGGRQAGRGFPQDLCFICVTDENYERPLPSRQTVPFPLFRGAEGDVGISRRTLDQHRDEIAATPSASRNDAAENGIEHQRRADSIRPRTFWFHDRKTRAQTVLFVSSRGTQ